MKNKRKIISYAILISLISYIFMLPFFGNFENTIKDSFFKMKYYGKVRENSIDDIVIIDIDSRSEKKLGKYPWGRDKLAKVMTVLKKKKINCLGLDMLINTTQNSHEDSILYREMNALNSVIIGYNFSDPDKYNFIYPDTISPILEMTKNKIINTGFNQINKKVMDIRSDNFVKNSFGAGFLNMFQDGDGSIRKTPLFIRYLGDLYPSMSLKLCMHYLKISNKDLILDDGKSVTLKNASIKGVKKDIKIPLDSDNNMRIHYKGTWKTFRTISFYDVLKNRIGRRTFKGKICLVGASLRGLMDLRTTPVQENLPGVEVHANIINTIIKNDFITSIEMKYLIIVLFFLIIATVFLVFSNLNQFFPVLILILYSFAHFYMSYYLFYYKSILFDISRPLETIIFTFIVSYIIKFYYESKDKQLIRNTLGKYVPDVVSDMMLQDPSKFKLGGEKKYITMFYTDIRNFTSISESMKANEVVEFLNDYLLRMTAIIKKNEGTLDKFIGDAIVCLFGTPLNNKHQHNACKTALNMIKELNKIKKNMGKFKDRFELNIGIGVHSGNVTVGNIGSMELFDYTAIGDNMNLASRVESSNKFYGTNILISGETYKAVKDDFFVREIDFVILKGKKTPIVLYELIDFKENEFKADYKFVEPFLKGLKLVRGNQFEKAAISFKEVLTIKKNDAPSIMYLDRIEILRKRNGPWNGVWTMSEK